MKVDKEVVKSKKEYACTKCGKKFTQYFAPFKYRDLPPFDRAMLRKYQILECRACKIDLLRERGFLERLKILITGKLPLAERSPIVLNNPPRITDPKMSK